MQLLRLELEGVFVARMFHHREQALAVLTGTVLLAVIVTCLYWARTVLIPVALAALLTFILAPLVAALQRRGLRRVPAVMLVVLGTALVLGGLLWLLSAQFTSLLGQLPQYTDNITAKIRALRESSRDSTFGRLEQMFQNIDASLKGSSGTSSEETTLPPSPIKVVSEPEAPAWLTQLSGYVGVLGETLAATGLVLVLTLFMLLNREDLRNRIIRLIGSGRITATTKAVDEAGQRISRFLVAQVTINGVYGLAVATALLVVGVKYAFLWGAIAALLRYVPYVGAWLTIALLGALSLAVFQGWGLPLLVIGVLVAIELITSNLAEPWLYGHSIGVSEVALLVAAAFWTFLWGPVGLILSSPLTVCLLVLGRHVPHLEFLSVLLGDEQVLAPAVIYYQRLLARDQDEAAQLASTQIHACPPERIFDDLLLPALIHAKRERERGTLNDDDEQFILRATQEIADDIDHQSACSSKDIARVGPPAVAIGYPAHDAVEQVALELLAQLLEPERWDLEVAAAKMLTAELVALAEKKEAALVCIGALPPDGLAHARYLCKRLRARLPHSKIVVGWWGPRSTFERDAEQLKEAGADLVAATLLETRQQMDGWRPALTDEHARTTTNGAASRERAAVGLG